MQGTDKLLYIIRHGETEFNKQSIIQGSGVDSELNDTGRIQANAFYQAYHQTPFELVICSALQRSYQTIEPFLELKIPLEKDSNINEINWGIHEGQKSAPWMIERFNQVVSQWKIGNYKASVEKGESAASLSTRLSTFLDRIRFKKESNILICSHGRTLRCLMCLINQEPLSEMEKYRHSNTGLFLIRQSGGNFVIEKNNDTAHLNGKMIL
jgi:probable phosphoglycerate mutase